jgi:hypothetical protein
MIKTVFGQRKDSPAFFDMACRFKPVGAGWYGTAFRMGDRAAVHIYLGDWRIRNPDRKLVVVEDSIMRDAEWSRYLPGDWLFSSFADELWCVESAGEVVPRPEGEALYHTPLWLAWISLNKTRLFNPSIVPPSSASASAVGKTSAMGIPDKYVTVHPLFDATYDVKRNSPPEWWAHLCARIAKEFPVVILGIANNAGRIGDIEGVYPAWRYQLNPMESLAMISKAKVHIGGATGLTIWSPIFKIPTLAAYSVWNRLRYGIEVRPISFGAPVVWGQLGGDVDVIFDAVRTLWGNTATSTPWED